MTKQPLLPAGTEIDLMRVSEAVVGARSGARHRCTLCDWRYAPWKAFVTTSQPERLRWIESLGVAPPLSAGRLQTRQAT